MLHRVQCEDSDNDPEELADEFEVVKKLGSGSYAVVYLVLEVRHELVYEEDVEYLVVAWRWTRKIMREP